MFDARKNASAVNDTERKLHFLVLAITGDCLFSQNSFLVATVRLSSENYVLMTLKNLA